MARFELYHKNKNGSLVFYSSFTNEEAAIKAFNWANSNGWILIDYGEDRKSPRIALSKL